MVLDSVAQHDHGNPEIVLCWRQVSFKFLPESNHEFRNTCKLSVQLPFALLPLKEIFLFRYPLPLVMAQAHFHQHVHLQVTFNDSIPSLDFFL